jgi:pimeloyl-ACP methyl ester carboxylesterase
MPPYRWYLTGFLVPDEGGEDRRSDFSAQDELDLAGDDDAGGDDAVEPERASQRKAFLPSSIGISVLVPEGADALEIDVDWGDDEPVGGEDDEEDAAAPPPAGMSDQEMAVLDVLKKFGGSGGLAYVKMMNARPQAVAYGMTDSPAGLAGWMLVHPGFEHWQFGRDPAQSPTKDEVLDDITLYWLTNSAASSARLYWENRGGELISAGSQRTAEIAVPVAITVFPDEVYRPPVTWARRAFQNLIYFNEAERGGHFAAWEYPEQFAAELRAAFRSLR